MISGNGFLAVAAREAAAKERKEAQKEIDSLKSVAKKAKEEAKEAVKEAVKEAAKAREEAVQFKTRLTVMHGWHRGAPSDLISDRADASPNEVRQLIARLEKVKNYCQTHPEHDVKTLIQLSELKTLLTLVAV